MTFDQFCKRNGVTPEERERLRSYLAFLRFLRVLDDLPE